MDPIDRSLHASTALRVGLLHTSAGIAALAAQSLVLAPVRNNKTRVQVPAVEEASKTRLSAPASHLILECVLQHTVLLSRVVANKALKNAGVDFQPVTTAAVVLMNYPVIAWRMLQSADVAKDDSSKLARVTLALKCFTRGILPCIMYEVGSQVISSVISDFLTDTLLDLNFAMLRLNDHTLIERIAQAAALSLGKIIMTPFEVVHKRQLVDAALALSNNHNTTITNTTNNENEQKQTKTPDPGFRWCLSHMREIVREEGFCSLYSGWWWAIPEAIGTILVRYVVYSAATNALV